MKQKREPPADLRRLRDVCKRVAARAMRADAGSWTLDTCPEERVAQAAVDLRVALTGILDELAAELKRR